MSWATLQALQVATLAVIAALTHLCVARLRRHFLDSLEELAGRVIRPFAAVSDIIATLLYVAFASATMPFGAIRAVVPFRIESMFDTVALFALLVATLQLVSLLILHRVAHQLEPWPPRPPEPPSP